MSESPRARSGSSTALGDPYRAPQAQIDDGAPELEDVPPLRGRTRAVKVALTLALVAIATHLVLILLARAGAGPPEFILACIPIASEVSGVLMIAAFVVSAVWFHRAVVRGRRLARYWPVKPGWAVALWIVPLLSLFRPFQVTREMWRIAHGGAKRPAWETLLFAVWWFAWLLSLQFWGWANQIATPESASVSVPALIAGPLFYWIVDGIASGQERRLGAA